MHELSLCSAIADAVTEHAAGRPVRRINLRVGHLRQVVPETLQFCWSMQSDDSPLAGAELAVEHVPAVVDCNGCGASTELDQPIPLCGTCGSGDVVLRTGEEFLIESIDLAPADDAGDVAATTTIGGA